MAYNYLDEPGTERLANHLKLKAITVNLLSNSWTPVGSDGEYTQTVSSSDIKSNSVIIVSNSGMTDAQKKVVSERKIKCTSQAAGSLTFTASGTVNIDLPVSVVVQGGAVTSQSNNEND